MIKAVVVGNNHGTIEMLHRRIGGILKDIAIVQTCLFSKVEDTDYDIYFCYAEGVRQKKLQQMFKWTNKLVIGAELTLLPIGIRKLNSLPVNSHIAVFAEHLQCANNLLGEIITAGVTQYRFGAYPINEIDDVKADYFVIPEESEEMMKPYLKLVKDRLILVPRTIKPSCASFIIKQAMSIA